MEQVVSNIISIQIIPVLLLPVTGLISLVFYNRAAAIHQRLRFVQKEMRDLLLQAKSTRSSQVEEMIQVLHKEIHFLHRRARLISISLICCLLAIGLFSLCALFVALGLFFSWAIQVALIFWFIGPVLICIGVASGIIELIFSAFSLQMQSTLIEKWGDFN